MTTWSVWDYSAAPDGGSEIQSWLDSFPHKQSEGIRSKLILKFTKAEVGGFREPDFEVLEGRYHDLIAIRWERDNVAFRVLACYGEGADARGEIWLLVGATEKNNKYDPPGIFDSALARRAAILADRRRRVSTCLSQSNK